MSAKLAFDSLLDRARGTHPRLWGFSLPKIARLARDYALERYKLGSRHGQEEAHRFWIERLTDSSHYDPHRDAYEIRLTMTAEEMARMTGRMR